MRDAGQAGDLRSAWCAGSGDPRSRSVRQPTRRDLIPQSGAPTSARQLISFRLPPLGGEGWGGGILRRYFV